MPMVTMYKNFMGIGGPGGVNYGLSKRLVQMYLLCLVREGNLSIALSGKKAPVEVIDYGNVADIDFRVPVLDSFEQIQLLRAPEGWELLAPYAAVILKDRKIIEVSQDADIQRVIQRVITFKEEQSEPFNSLSSGLETLLDEISQPNPLDKQMNDWAAFLESPIKREDSIKFLLHALDKSFNYRVYAEEKVRQEEVDDLATRQSEIEQAAKFYDYRGRLMAVSRYAGYLLPEEPKLAELQEALIRGREMLDRLDQLMLNETQLIGELLNPLEEAIETYSVRYLQLFDKVSTHTVTVRQKINALSQDKAYVTVSYLAQVTQLGADPRPALEQAFSVAVEGPPELFPTEITRADVQRRLPSWPEPSGCPLTFSNAGEWMQRADKALANCQQALREALLEKAALLHSDALRQRLAQGESEPFVSDLLSVKTQQEMADQLIRSLGEVGEDEAQRNLEILSRYLHKVTVIKVQLADFVPSRRTVEIKDVDQIVGEFKEFLLEHLQATAEDEIPVFELE